MLQKRVLGRTGYEVTEIGFGAWAIGGRGYGDVPEADAQEALETYVEEGGNFIDTATRYGDSEEIIGRFLQRTGVRERLILCSKTPALEADEIRSQVQLSLERMGVDTIELYYLHGPPEDPSTMHYVLETFQGLKEEGLIGAVGASIKGPSVTQKTVELCRQYIRTGMVDALQVIYSIFRPKNREMFDEAAAAGVGIVARTALESGFLTGKYEPGDTFGDDDHRRRWSGERLENILAEAQRLEDELVQEPYDSLAQVALRFVLDDPGISTLIVGAKSARQARENVEAASLPSLDADVWQDLVHRFGGREEEFNPGD